MNRDQRTIASCTHTHAHTHTHSNQQTHKHKTQNTNTSWGWSIAAQVAALDYALNINHWYQFKNNGVRCVSSPWHHVDQDATGWSHLAQPCAAPWPRQGTFSSHHHHHHERDHGWVGWRSAGGWVGDTVCTGRNYRNRRLQNGYGHLRNRGSSRCCDAMAGCGTSLVCDDAQCWAPGSPRCSDAGHVLVGPAVDRLWEHMQSPCVCPQFATWTPLHHGSPLCSAIRRVRPQQTLAL